MIEGLVSDSVSKRASREVVEKKIVQGCDPSRATRARCREWNGGATARKKMNANSPSGTSSSPFSVAMIAVVGVAKISRSQALLEI